MQPELSVKFNPPTRRSKRTIAGLVAVLTLLLLLSLWTVSIFAVKPSIRYEIQNANLIITSHHVLWTSTDTIAAGQVEQLQIATLEHGSRRFGTALPGYCTGDFAFGGLGPVKVVSDCSLDVVVIHLKDNKPFVITPSDRTAFIKAWLNRQSSTFTPPPVPQGSSVPTPAFLPLLVMAVVCLIAVLGVYGPKRVRYLVQSDSLVIKTLFGRKRISIPGLRVSTHSTTGGFRLFGTSLPGYYTGLFLTDGKKTRVYATSFLDGVLLESDIRVYINPERRREFIEALRIRGATVLSS